MPMACRPRVAPIQILPRRRTLSVMVDDDTITLTGSGSGTQPMPEIDIPLELGPVRLLNEIGRGGMGVVYLGRHQLLSRDVAVKFLLNAHDGSDGEGFGRFLTGARNAATVHHAGLTTIHHADIVGDIPYLVMEYIDGPTLSGVLKRTGAFELAPALTTLDAIASAIQALHQNDIVHRDVKPSNVLLDRDARIVVTDFGLAINRKSAGFDSPAGLAGTPMYMAPEMFDQVVSPKTDVYSLGLIAFELLAGRTPFTGTVQEIKDQHINSPLPIEALSDKKIDATLIELIERAAHKNAVYRFKSAGHFLQALRETKNASEHIRNGAAQLEKRIAATLAGETTEVERVEMPTTPPSSYFDRLSSIAKEKRAQSGRVDENEESETESAADVDADAPVAADLPCVHCGYNLRGGRTSGKCPECATPIERSLGRDLLANSDTKFLTTVYQGMTCVHYATVAVVAVFGMVLLSLPLFVLGATRVVNALTWVLQSSLPLAISLMLLGVYRFTVPEPRLACVPSEGFLKSVSRISASATLILVFAEWCLSLAGIHIPYAMITYLIVAGGIVITIVSATLYLSRLCDRIPDPKLAKACRDAAAKFVACIALSVTIATVQKVTGSAAKILNTLTGIAEIAAFLYFVSIIGRWRNAREALKRCLESARALDRAADGDRTSQQRQL